MSTLPGKPSKRQKSIAIRRFSEHIDPDLLAHLLDGSGNDRMETLWLLLQDPAYAKESFSKLCQKARVSLSDLHELYINGVRQLALIQASQTLPALMMDIAQDARTTQQACHRCDGVGFIIERATGDHRDCPACQGTGLLRKIGDKQARELMLQSSKMIGHTPPPIAIQTTTTVNVVDMQLESILKKTREIVLDKPTTIAIKAKSE